MLPIVKTTLPLATRTAGIARRSVKARTRGALWPLAGIMWLLLAMSTAAESPQTETVEPNTDAVSDSNASREHFYYGKKGLTNDPEGPTNLWTGVRLQTRFDDYRGKIPAMPNSGSSGTRSSI